MSRNTPELLRLARAAIRMADLMAVPNDSERAKSTEYNNEFIHWDEELREAAVAYDAILDDHDKRRIGWGERTIARWQ